jgi:hypothetical protein
MQVFSVFRRIRRAGWIAGCAYSVASIGIACAQVPMPIDPLGSCGAIADQAVRYKCYDDVEREKSRPVRPPATQPASPQRKSLFGPSDSATIVEPKQILSEVQAISFDEAGKFTVTLANGEIWHQFDADSGTAAFSKSGRNLVKIVRGFWDSYDLQINNQHATYRVKRLK